jgi:hypothetical protein
LPLVVVEAAHLKVFRCLVGHADEAVLIVAALADGHLAGLWMAKNNIRGAPDKEDRRENWDECPLQNSGEHVGHEVAADLQRRLLALTRWQSDSLPVIE